MTNANSRISLGTKLTYVVIVLLWLSAGGAVYFTFFAPGATRAKEAAEDSATDPKAQANAQSGTDEPKPIVLNVKGEVVDPEEFKLPAKLPEFELMNQSNEKVSRDSLKGKPWVGTFVFTRCPGPCTLITGRMKVLQNDMKHYDFNLVTFTVDPEFDTPEQLTKYSQAFSADLSNWNFLTGDRGDIYSLIWEGFKLPVKEEKPGVVIHTNNFVLVDAEGNYVETFNAMEDEEFLKLKKQLRGLAVRKTETDSPVSSEEPAEKPKDGE